MKVILCLLLTLVSATIYAQSITTTVSKDFSVNGTSKYYMFKEGESVIIHGFKKKGDKYHFAVETKEDALFIHTSYIPFDIEEKQLKKLPNAISPSMDAFLKQRGEEIKLRKKDSKKQECLDGKCRFIVYSESVFRPEEGAIGKVEEGDTIYVLGCEVTSSLSRRVALYSSSAVGIFTATGKSYTDWTFFPQTTDTDVKIALGQKKNELLQRLADEREHYQARALRGEVKGILNKTFSPFKDGDTISIVGYSEINDSEKYALYSDNWAGVYNEPKYSLGKLFKNDKDIIRENLLSVDAPEVIAVIERQKAMADSLNAIKDSLMLEELNEVTNNLIEIYKKRDPVIVQVDSWSSNSAGRIEVNLSVTNCSTQTIKYISFQGYFTNAVGDKCRNEIGGSTIWKARGIGPIGSRPTTLDNFKERYEECRASYDFDNLTFYSKVADRFHLSSVSIQYMNGKTITLSGSNLNSHVIYK